MQTPGRLTRLQAIQSLVVTATRVMLGWLRACDWHPPACPPSLTAEGGAWKWAVAMAIIEHMKRPPQTAAGAPTAGTPILGHLPSHASHGILWRGPVCTHAQPLHLTSPVDGGHQSRIAAPIESHALSRHYHRPAPAAERRPCRARGACLRLPL